MRLICFATLVVLVCCNAAFATIYRDRTAFNAATQNLHLIDFENVPQTFEHNRTFDGILFHNIGGGPGIFAQSNPPNKVLFGPTIGEITILTIFLPPGTTAVGLDQFTRPMNVVIPNGEMVSMTDPNESNFVGFVTDQPIERITVTLDFPEPTPGTTIDNLVYGQRRAGNEPPTPLLLNTHNTTRAVALNSVTLEKEPFRVLSTRNRAPDGRTRITLFLVGVLLLPSDQPFVTVQAQNAQQNVFNLPVEGTGIVFNLSWMSQVTVLLPDALNAAGEVKVTVNVRGKVSNQADLRID